MNLRLSLASFVALLLGFTGVASAWSGPSGSPPNNNVSAPINVGSTFQEKSGSAWFDGGVGINSGSGFCIGSSCITAWSQAGASSQWTTSGSVIYYNGGSVGIGTASPGSILLYVNQSGSSWAGEFYASTNGLYVKNSPGSYVELADGSTGGVFYGASGNGLTAENAVGSYAELADGADGVVASSSAGIYGELAAGTWSLYGDGPTYTSSYSRADGGFCIGSSCITSWPTGASGPITGPYVPAYSTWNSSGTGGGGAAIYNDNGSYKSLMIVGNSSAGGNREVHVWDDLTVNNNLTAENNLTVDGSAGISGDLTVNGSLNLDSNQIWNTAGPLYLQYSGPAGTVIVGGGSTVQNLDVVNGAMYSPEYCIGSSCITSWGQIGPGQSSMGGSGTAGYIPRFTAGTTLGNSSISDNGSSATANGNFFVDGYLYDGANTGYYLKPSGSSNLDSATFASGPYTNDWFRLNGGNGVYWDAYNTGIQSYDSTWVRVFPYLYVNDGYDSGGASGAGCGGEAPGSGYTFKVCGTQDVTGMTYAAGGVLSGGTLELSGNQVWNTGGTLYLNYSAPANSNVYVGGQSGVAQSLVIPSGSLCLNGNCISNWSQAGPATGTAIYSCPVDADGTLLSYTQSGNTYTSISICDSSCIGGLQEGGTCAYSTETTTVQGYNISGGQCGSPQTVSCSFAGHLEP